ncbi:STAS domain-containing protein [Streptomyces sp. NBC_00006]|uniref:STAS domain-containing protein n=1 Tax=unclassified Streptomyces TaxID=2593676 RepID=UPI0022502626|nr:MULTISPECIES: STAS domain-containing protein [unclassified Streptomyces]MCX4835181.1 STAS domain-containing protein [Streptomyces sp. NBC_01016]MCX5537608.1 STAS domain-containing protein [Streptomyces sp. NBC_00006]
MSTQAGRLSVTELARCEHCAVLRVSGELDQNCEQFFLRAIGSLVLSGHRHLVLDVTALTFCDSRGLNCLLAARWLLQRREGMLLLAGPGRRLSDLLVQTASNELLPSHSTVSQALKVLPRHHRPVWPPPAHDGEGAAEPPAACTADGEAGQ